MRPAIDLSDGTEIEFIRADGGCVCVRCGKEYWRHPVDERVLEETAAPGGCELVLRILCSGERVKL